MKQQITKEQWDEVDKKYLLKWVQSFKPSVTVIDWEGVRERHLPTIGQLIEYLGDDFRGVSNINEEGWNVRYKEIKKPEEHFKSKELTDALWEATKHKLKN